MPPDKLGAKHQAIIDDLRTKTGVDFDKAYIEAQCRARDEAVELFRGYARDGENVRMRTFAAHVLPSLEAHLGHLSYLR